MVPDKFILAWVSDKIMGMTKVVRSGVAITSNLWKKMPTLTSICFNWAVTKTLLMYSVYIGDYTTVTSSNGMSQRYWIGIDQCSTGLKPPTSYLEDHPI